MSLDQGDSPAWRHWRRIRAPDIAYDYRELEGARLLKNKFAG